MATALKKTRLHELESYAGTPQGGVLLYSKDNKEYKIDVDKLAPVATVATVNGSNNAATLDFNTSTDIILVLNDPTTTVTFAALTNVAENTRFEVMLTFKQGTGANKVTWPENVKWPHGAQPVLSYAANAEDTLSLYTLDGGVTWKGSLLAAGY